MIFHYFLQPVGFVTFQTRAGAEAAKQDLQVRIIQNMNYIKLFVLLYYNIYYFPVINSSEL